MEGVWKETCVGGKGRCGRVEVGMWVYRGIAVRVEDNICRWNGVELWTDGNECLWRQRFMYVCGVETMRVGKAVGGRVGVDKEKWALVGLRSPTHSLTHSFIQSTNQSHTYSFTHPLTHSPFHSFSHFLPLLVTHAPILLSFTYPQPPSLPHPSTLYLTHSIPPLISSRPPSLPPYSPTVPPTKLSIALDFSALLTPCLNLRPSTRGWCLIHL